MIDQLKQRGAFWRLSERCRTWSGALTGRVAGHAKTCIRLAPAHPLYDPVNPIGGECEANASSAEFEHGAGVESDVVCVARPERSAFRERSVVSARVARHGTSE